MAFANIGAAAGLVAVANMRPAGTLVANVGGDATAGANLRKTGSALASRISGAEERSALNRLEIFVGAVRLLDSVAVTTAANPNAAHTGQFTTAVAGADQHGLPANFGPGRGRWVADDLAKVSVLCDGTSGGAGLAASFRVNVTKAIVANDLVITIQNVGGATTTAEWFNASIILSYEAHE